MALPVSFSELAGWPFQWWHLLLFPRAFGEYTGVVRFMSEDRLTLSESVPASGGLRPVRLARVHFCVEQWLEITHPPPFT